MRTLLLVCTGNTCRSSMAEALARQYLEEKKRKAELQVISAGLAAVEGAPATPEAIQAAGELGADLRGHRARHLTPELVEQADLILTMTREHKQEILRRMPQARGKVYTLKEFAGGLDIKELEQRSVEVAANLAAAEREFASKYVKDRQRLAELQVEISNLEAHLAEREAEFNQATAATREELARLTGELEKLDVPDPLGLSLDDYRQCARDLQQEIARALDRYFSQ